jgi:hypothetical protein
MAQDNTNKKATGNQTITQLHLISAYIRVTRAHFCSLLHDLLSILRQYSMSGNMIGE